MDDDRFMYNGKVSLVFMKLSKIWEEMHETSQTNITVYKVSVL